MRGEGVEQCTGEEEGLSCRQAVVQTCGRHRRGAGVARAWRGRWCERGAVAVKRSSAQAVAQGTSSGSGLER